MSSGAQSVPTGMPTHCLATHPISYVIIYQVFHKCNKFMFCNAVLARCSGWNIRPVCLTFTANNQENVVSNPECFESFFKRCMWNTSIECRKSKCLAVEK